MLVDKKTYEGKVARDKYGSYDDCSPGLYLDEDLIEGIINEYEGKNIRLTIEVLEQEQKD